MNTDCNLFDVLLFAFCASGSLHIWMERCVGIVWVLVYGHLSSWTFKCLYGHICAKKTEAGLMWSHIWIFGSMTHSLFLGCWADYLREGFNTYTFFFQMFPFSIIDQNSVSFSNLLLHKDVENQFPLLLQLPLYQLTLANLFMPTRHVQLFNKNTHSHIRTVM